MTKEQANKEMLKIFRESLEKQKEVEKAAKENGTWLPGLDANNALFEKIHKETMGKINKLKNQIDE